MKRLILTLALAAVLAPAAFARVRTVRHPAEPCSFSLLPAWGAAPVPAAGLTRGIVFVYGQTATCAQWNGYSSVDWVMVEAAPLDAQPAAYVTISPNLGAEARATTLVIAGIRLDLTQEGAPTITNPSLVTNGTFHANIDGWIWYDGRFPKLSGTAMWSPLDANGSPASGSILLRDNGSTLAFQRLQCIAVIPRTRYRYGAKVRTGAPSERGAGTVALFTYKSTDCSGDEFSAQITRVVSPDEPEVWQDYLFTMTAGSQTRSIIFLIASGASVHPFDTYFDDIFFEPSE